MVLAKLREKETEAERQNKKRKKTVVQKVQLVHKTAQAELRGTETETARHVDRQVEKERDADRQTDKNNRHRKKTYNKRQTYIMID